ncbi:hypothetical protein D1159_14875 [Pseudoflavonifractor sp. 524-17]|uniref:zinc-dependent alcohol dehydrogenase n=1 Tax=Pseudoflavonifractor sp. 524-17 TaxID=2304577 RepID=UPI00137B132F|nr:zinc-binding dehydrogenase [Pseudoflavonifractor sp. 524-17]NCE65824.1 hypothetical protein [Pseudoflavonifractor sp. 524-17]
MNMRQIQFDGVGQLRQVERPIPPLKDDQVLVKVEACGLCTWERYIYEGTESMPFPFVGGHEIAGTVVETGKAVSGDIQPGMPVSVAKWVRCNQCEPCRRGFDNHCLGNDGPSDRGYSGPAGFADYLVCQSYEVFPFAPGVPIHYAALAEPVACVTRGVNKLGAVGGDTAVVIGAGFMGLLFLKLLKLRGCKVIVVQRSAKRRELAAQMGADLTLDPAQSDWTAEVMAQTGGMGAAAVVYTAGGSQTVNQCLAAARVGATVLLYAPTHEDRPAIDLDLIHFKELVLTGAIRHDKESFRQAVRLLGSGQVDFSDLSLSFGSMADLEGEMKRANTDRDIHRILLKW